jgi:transposase
MIKTKTTEEEIIVLRAYAKSSPLLLVRLKSQAILMAGRGIPREDICAVLGRCGRTVRIWLSNWEERRLASLFTGHQDNGNASKLTKQQREDIKQALAQPPFESGIPGSFWDVPKLKTYVEVSFGVVYESEQSYHFLLKFSNLSFKYPDTFDQKRNLGLINARMNAICAELAPLFRDKEWEIFAVDEVRMEQEAIIRRAWLKRGERTVVKVDRNKQAQSYIGFLNQKTADCEIYEMPWQNSDEVLKAMKLFLNKHPNKKICIVWDNAPFHKSKIIREELRTGGLLERVHLIPMPPYAPDHNPIEHVWGAAKQSISNIQKHTFEQTKTAFTDYVTGRKFKYSF